MSARTEAQKAVAVSLLCRRHAAGWLQQQRGDPAGGEMSSGQGRMQTPLLVLEKARSISLPVASNSSLRKLGGTQPTGYRLRPYAKFFRNRELGMPLTPQLHHGQVLLVSCLAASLPARFDQRRSSASLRHFRPSLHLQLLDLALDRLRQIAHQVISIVDLQRRRRAFSPALSIQTTAVLCDHLHSRMQPKQLGTARGRAHGKQIDHSSPLEIHDHGPVPLLFPPCPV